MKRLDLSGYQKGRLTVIDFSHSHIQPSGQKRAMWNVVCECGTKKVMSTTNLTHGKIVSCGCKRKEGTHRLPTGQASLNHKYNVYKFGAKHHKTKDLCFDLTKDQFAEITSKPCHYCGCLPVTNTLYRQKANGAYLSNGIDRVDSSKGYVIDNCVPCCTVCNRMKLDMDVDQFHAHIERIYRHATHKVPYPQSNGQEHQS